MIVGIAVETTVDSNDARAVTRMRAAVTARRRAGSKRGAEAESEPTRGSVLQSWFGFRDPRHCYSLSAMRVLTGTSGFSYKEWKGSFYPEDLPAEEMLRLYVSRLPALHI